MPWRGSSTTTSAQGRGWRPDQSKADGREGRAARGWNPTGSGTKGMVVGGLGEARAAEGQGADKEGREGTWEVKGVLWGADREV